MKNFDIPVAVKRLANGYELKLLLASDPETLDTFVTSLADPGKTIYFVHSPQSRWVSLDLTIEMPLGFRCPSCGEPVRRYSGEWQERVLCGCTLCLFSLELVQAAKDVDAEFWADLICQWVQAKEDRESRGAPHLDIQAGATAVNLMAELSVDESALVGLSKIAEIADVSVNEVALEIIEDFLLNIELARDELAKSSVLRHLVTTRLFPTRAQAEAAAARYNDLVDKLDFPDFYDGSRAQAIEAISASQEVTGYWVQIDRL